MGIQSPTLCYLSWQEGAETTDSLVQVRWIPRLPWNCLESPNFLGFNLCAFDQILNKRQIAEKVDISIPSLFGVTCNTWYMVYGYSQQLLSSCIPQIGKQILDPVLPLHVDSFISPTKMYNVSTPSSNVWMRNTMTTSKMYQCRLTLTTTLSPCGESGHMRLPA